MENIVMKAVVESALWGLLVVKIFLSLQILCKLKFGLQKSAWLPLDLEQSKGAGELQQLY